MKVLELNPHRINFDRMAAEWRKYFLGRLFRLLICVVATEFGIERPSPTEIKRHLENLLDKALEKGHVQPFRIKKLRAGSIYQQTGVSQALDHERSATIMEDGARLKCEDENGNDVWDDFDSSTPTGVRQKDPTRLGGSSNTNYPTPSSISRGNWPGPQPESHDHAGNESPTTDDSESLQSVQDIVARGKQPKVALRTMPRPNYEGDILAEQENDSEYDPAAEKVEEERKLARRERMRQRAASKNLPQGRKPKWALSFLSRFVHESIMC
jgi:hypothetical protein